MSLVGGTPRNFPPSDPESTLSKLLNADNNDKPKGEPLITITDCAPYQICGADGL